MNVTLKQLVGMTPEQREIRLRGIPEVTRLKLLQEAAELLSSISSAGVAKNLKIVV